MESDELWDHFLLDSLSLSLVNGVSLVGLHADEGTDESGVEDNLGCVVEELELVLLELISHQKLGDVVLRNHGSDVSSKLCVVFNYI